MFFRRVKCSGTRRIQTNKCVGEDNKKNTDAEIYNHNLHLSTLIWKTTSHIQRGLSFEQKGKHLKLTAQPMDLKHIDN